MVQSLLDITQNEGDRESAADLVMELLPKLAARTSVVGGIAYGVIDLYVRVAPFASPESKTAFLATLTQIPHAGELIEAFEYLLTDDQSSVPDLFKALKDINPSLRPIQLQINGDDNTPIDDHLERLLKIGQDKSLLTLDRIEALREHLYLSQKNHRPYDLSHLLEIGRDENLLASDRITALDVLLMSKLSTPQYIDQDPKNQALKILARMSGINEDTEGDSDPESAIEAAIVLHSHTANHKCIIRAQMIANNEEFSDATRMKALNALKVMHSSEIESHPAYQRWKAPITREHVDGALTHIRANPFPPLTPA